MKKVMMTALFAMLLPTVNSFSPIIGGCYADDSLFGTKKWNNEVPSRDTYYDYNNGFLYIYNYDAAITDIEIKVVHNGNVVLWDIIEANSTVSYDFSQAENGTYTVTLSEQGAILSTFDIIK